MAERYCMCGHLVERHYAPIVGAKLEGVAVKNGVANPAYRDVKYGPFQCHASFCHCRLYTEDKSLMSKIKRKLGVK